MAFITSPELFLSCRRAHDSVGVHCAGTVPSALGHKLVETKCLPCAQPQRLWDSFHPPVQTRTDIQYKCLFSQSHTIHYPRCNHHGKVPFILASCSWGLSPYLLLLDLSFETEHFFVSICEFFKPGYSFVLRCITLKLVKA